MRAYFLSAILLCLSLFLPFALAESITDSEMRGRLLQLTCLDCGQDTIAERVSKTRSDWAMYGVDPNPNGFGFYPADSEHLPPAVRQAAQSVFQVVVFASDTAKSRVRSDLRSELEQTLSEGGDSRWWARVLAERLTRCGQGEVCSIPDKSSAQIGTAFLLASDPHELLSASHVLRAAVLAHRGASAAKLNFYLFDQDGNPVVTPESNPARVTRFPRPSEMTTLDSDLVRIRLQTPISRPGLKFASAAPQSGEASFNLGFGNCSGCNEKYADRAQWFLLGSRFPFTEAPGGKLVATIGSVYDVGGEGRFLSSIADGIPGMSGGPTLNQNGEVVGVVTGYQLAFFDDGLSGRLNPNAYVVHVLKSTFPQVDDPARFLFTGN